MDWGNIQKFLGTLGLGAIGSAALKAILDHLKARNENELRLSVDLIPMPDPNHYGLRIRYQPAGVARRFKAVVRFLDDMEVKVLAVSDFDRAQGVVSVKEIVFGYVNSVRNHVRNYLLASPKVQRHPNLTPFTSGLGHIKLRALTRRAVEEFKERLRIAGVSVASTRAILKSLHSALDYAQSRDLVYANVATGVRVSGLRNEATTKVKPPTPAM